MKNNYYKLGLHIHTTLSDGALSPEQVALMYKQNGYDAIAFTDHWKYYPEGELCGLTIISGIEYNTGKNETITDVMHIVGLGMQCDPELTRENSRQQIVDQINQNGGVAVLAHPHWSLNSVDDAKSITGFLATEIYNSASNAHQSTRPCSDYFVDLCANAGVYFGILATDDTHFYDGSDNCKSWVMVKADDCSQASLLKGLKNGDFYASQGPELYVERNGDDLKITCSPCSVITVLSNLSIRPEKTARGDNLTQFDYTIDPNERWLRVEVIDKDGNRAWSNIIRKDT